MDINTLANKSDIKKYMLDWSKLRGMKGSIIYS